MPTKAKKTKVNKVQKPRALPSKKAVSLRKAEFARKLHTARQGNSYHKLEQRKVSLLKGSTKTLNIKVRKIKSRDVILVLDFGSQYTQLIARRIRECKVFSQIVPFNITPDRIKELGAKGLILSGGPMSVYDKDAPHPNKEIFKMGLPILGVCYGLQVITQMFGGKVNKSKDREYGRAELFIDSNKDLFSNLPTNLTCWMSHGDEIISLPPGFEKIAHTLNNGCAAFANRSKKIYGVQFHPEVVHTQRGVQVLQNFTHSICGCLPRWTMDRFIDASIKKIQETVGNKKVVLGLSGGVDSSVAAVLISKAIGMNLYCIFVDNGVLRKNEAKAVHNTFKGNFRMNFHVVDASKRFLKELAGVTDPEEKRKIIGRVFVEVFQENAKRIKSVEFLGQGTLYPDVIESVSPTGGPSAVIKSHHNVGGLPKSLHLQLLEPLRDLFKDEVRAIGKVLGLQDVILKRQPFPGPGLAIRILGDVTEERLNILREADERVLEEIKKANLYNEVWQSFAVLLPVKTVGVMGDQRTYENVIAIRCVSSVDGMTADWVHLPYELLGKISNRIINEVRGVNRVVYDISSKPPATIEWE
ncbi:MAG: glutamine-hydrolyzing GMP synthase [Candidatus Omnitrophica bacterium]|nr:glutamine-hydrolyzing GMP synthase [Candidatus Omnitrophota bacterium]